MTQNTSSTALTDSKQHYYLLDGLRGVAALMVIVYHLFECFPADTWIIGHGYLAVDFFFILSGFVVGYAYDDRWSKSLPKHKRLNVWRFFKRRLIRLHPMVVMGVALGVLAFCLQGGTRWDGTHVAISAVMMAVLLHLFFIPEMPGASSDIRGNGEMFPLNGPHWSLFFEYIGNILYALLLRRLTTKWLTAWVVVMGVAFAAFGVSDIVGYGNIGVGWTLDGMNFWGGLLRMTFPFSCGLLMSRVFKPMKIRGAFWICTFVIVAFLSIPNLGSFNCLYEVACVIVVFPLVVYMAASGTTSDSTSTSLCRFLGDISYPLYAVHYPSMYLFYHYIGYPNTWRTPAETWPWMLALIAGNIMLAYATLHLYDSPLRTRLSKAQK